MACEKGRKVNNIVKEKRAHNLKRETQYQQHRIRKYQRQNNSSE